MRRLCGGLRELERKQRLYMRRFDFLQGMHAESIENDNAIYNLAPIPIPN